MKRVLPEIGTMRKVKKFLWFSVTLYNRLTDRYEEHWLERVTVIEKFSRCGYWSDVGWIDPDGTEHFDRIYDPNEISVMKRGLE